MINRLKLKYSFELKLEWLRAMAKFASRDEARYILNGVLVEVGPARQIVLVATNGRTLAAFSDSGTLNFVPEWQFVFPNELIEAIPVNLRTLRMPLLIDCYHHEEKEGEVIKVSFGDVTASMRPVEGNYPRWRCVLPDPIPTTFDATFLAANMKMLGEYFSAASELIGHDTLTITGDEAIYVLGQANSPRSGEFIGTMIPTRTPDVLKELPLWAQEK